MDLLNLQHSLKEGIQKYRYLWIVVLAGILLMMLPQSGMHPQAEKDRATASAEQIPTLQESLTQLLSQIHGAGKVQVLLTESRGTQTFYVSDEEKREGELRQKTVLVRQDSTGEKGLIRQINAPVYRGAVVLCQGADSPSVRLSLVRAVVSVTGLTSDKVTILKMK